MNFDSVDFDLDGFFHALVQPLTDLFQDEWRVPELLAPTLALCVGIFVPLYFASAVFFWLYGYRGSQLCVLSDAMPSLRVSMCMLVISAHSAAFPDCSSDIFTWLAIHRNGLKNPYLVPGPPIPARVTAFELHRCAGGSSPVPSLRLCMAL